jgi:hypothetical protein
MTAIEVDIGPAHGLYARYLQPVPGHEDRNLFDPAARTDFASDEWMTSAAGKLADLRSAGLVVDDADGVTLAPLRGLLVLPRTPAVDGTPFVLIMHGMSPTFHPPAATAAHEVPSYRGYAYFQRHLAQAGIGSLSVNVNVVNAFSTPGVDDDYQRRAQVLVLHFALVSALASGTVPAGSPLRCRLPAGVVPLDSALAEAAPASGGPAALVQALAATVSAARLDFTRLGVLGHSRGATAVAELAERIHAAGGGAGAGAARDSRERVVAEARRHIETLISDLGAPLPEHLKAVVPLEPDDAGPFPLALPDVFLLAVAGSHDEDVHSSAANIYEGATCPKALLMLHGATHGRFNTVWRELPHTNRTINESIRCQAPIHILSNASHEALLTSFAGSCFAGRLLGQAEKLLIFTGERRGPSGTDVTRCWRFPLPVDDADGVVALDAGITTLRTATGTATPAKDALRYRFIDDWSVYAQYVEALRIVRPADESAELVVPLDGGTLADFTHLSFRVAKEHDARTSRGRAAEPLRNFELALYSDAGVQVGRTIAGTAVPSILHRVYPVRKWTDADGPPQCYDDTKIFLQTVEVPLTQFAAADLSPVRELRLGMLPVARSGEDVFVLIDFLITRRTLPPPP